MKINKLMMLQKIYKFSNTKLFENKIEPIKCVYFLFNEELKLIYVGRTINLRQRICGHVSPRVTNRTSPVPLKRVSYYSFIKIKNNRDRELTELILINIFNPLYNHTKYRH